MTRNLPSSGSPQTMAWNDSAMFHIHSSSPPTSTKKAARRAAFLSFVSPALFLVFHVHVLGVNHAFVLLLLLACAIARGSRLRARTWAACRRRLLRLVHGLSQLVRGLGQLLAGRIHGCRVRAFQGLLGVRQRRFHLPLLIAGDLVAMLLQGLFHLVDHAVKLVAGLDLLALGFVFRRVRFGFLGHPLD